MSRTLTAGMLAAIDLAELKPIRLVALHFDGGSEYHTTAYKPIVYDGNTYNTGNLISIGTVKESLEVKVPTLNIALSGVNQANISTALSEDSIDRVVVVYSGLLDANDDLVVDPIEEFRGRLDSFQFSENPEQEVAEINWSCVSQLQDFERVAGRRTNDDDQQFHFAGDEGFEFSALTDTDIKWGRA